MDLDQLEKLNIFNVEITRKSWKELKLDEPYRIIKAERKLVYYDNDPDDPKMIFLTVEENGSKDLAELDIGTKYSSFFNEDVCRGIDEGTVSLFIINYERNKKPSFKIVPAEALDRERKITQLVYKNYDQ